MKWASKILVLTAVAVSLAACGRTGTSSGAPSGPVAVGDPAPAFSLPSANGERVSLSDYTRRSVLLYFSMGPG